MDGQELGPYSLTQRLLLVEIGSQAGFWVVRPGCLCEVWAASPIRDLDPSPPPPAAKGPKLQGPPMAALPPGLGSPWTLSSLLRSRGLWGLERGGHTPKKGRRLVLWTGAQRLRGQSHPGRVCAEWVGLAVKVLDSACGSDAGVSVFPRQGLFVFVCAYAHARVGLA